MTRCLQLLALVLVFINCGSAKPGEAGGPCDKEGVCNDGLVCQNKTCQKVGAADCGQIAQKVGYLTLSNYETPDNRTRFEETIRQRCAGASLTKAEADCILKASSEFELNQCPRKMGALTCRSLFEESARKYAKEPSLSGVFQALDMESAIATCQEQRILEANPDCLALAENDAELRSCFPQ